MSNNSSADAGYLTPIGSDRNDDETLERQLSRWIRGVTGLPDTMVRPRWTSELAAMQLPGVNWCSFGITKFTPDANPAFVNQSDGDTQMWRHETFECLISFYGPAGQRNVSVFYDGATIPQNNDELVKIGLSFISSGAVYAVPELLNDQWVRRYDITVRLRRKVIREYGIKSLVEAPVKFFGE